MKAWMTILVMTTAAILLTACGEETKEPDTAVTTTTTAAVTTVTTTQPSADETMPTDMPQGVPEINGDSVSVVDNEDGTFTRMTYDEQGNIVRSELLDGDDTVLEETVFDREFDDNGKLLRETVFTDAIKVSEGVYAYSTEAEGETYLAEETLFCIDGTKEVTVYDEVSMNYKTTFYGADGQAQNAEEYLYADDGSLTTVYYEGEDMILRKEIAKTDDNGNDTLITLDADGNIITTQVCEYDATGMIVTVYDGDGNELTSERVEFDPEAAVG